MKNICTVSDKKYILQGLSLLYSLEKYSHNFKLHYLAIDDETETKLVNLKNPNLVVYPIRDFLDDKNLSNLFNTNYKYFCWSLASYFSNFLIEKFDSILYCDSDIYFHDNINILYESFGKTDVGIFKHRQFEYEQNRPEGAYNVGVVYFKNSEKGRQVSDWWKDAVLFRKYPHLSTCGDQKYLDHFQNLCEKNEIFIDGSIGHGSPWEWQLYSYDFYLEDENIMWKGEKQKLLFSHFSQFAPNLETNTYIPSTQHHCYTKMNDYKENISLKKIYDDYFDIIKLQYKKITI